MRVVLLVSLLAAACSHKAKPAQAPAAKTEAAPAPAPAAEPVAPDDAKQASPPKKTSGDPCEGGQ